MGVISSGGVVTIHSYVPLKFYSVLLVKRIDSPLWFDVLGHQ